MKSLILVMLVLVIALPSVASAVVSSGPPVLVPDPEAAVGAGTATKAWSDNTIFFVRAHVCLTLNVTLCGPDPLIASAAAFNDVIRLWVPLGDVYTVHFVVADTEGAVVALSTGSFTLPGNSYASFFRTFPALSDGLYKFLGVAIGGSFGLVTFSNHYQFRTGGPGSNGCCP